MEKRNGRSVVIPHTSGKIRPEDEPTRPLDPEMTRRLRPEELLRSAPPGVETRSPGHQAGSGEPNDDAELPDEDDEEDDFEGNGDLDEDDDDLEDEELDDAEISALKEDLADADEDDDEDDDDDEEA
jgi:hypothetical protein